MRQKRADKLKLFCLDCKDYEANWRKNSSLESEELVQRHKELKKDEILERLRCFDF